MADTKVFSFPETGNNSNIPFSIPIGGNGFGGFGNGMNGIVDLFGLAIIASIFGWNNGGFGGWGGNAGGAGFLSNQLNNDSGRELLMNAITSQGEASRTAIQSLATALGQDFNLVDAGIRNVQNTLNSMAIAMSTTPLQIINAIQAGDNALANQFAKACCDNQLALCQQTNQLGSQADRNTNSLLSAINAQTVAMNDQFCALKERELQSKIDTQADIITQLRGQIDNANQTAAITGYVNSLVAPLQAKVGEIADKMPNTVPVQWPQLTAVNTTPYVNGGFYGNGYFGGNGFGGNIVF